MAAVTSKRKDEIPLVNPPVTLSLISHTNAGKTTLARTLLRRDVGGAGCSARDAVQ